MRSNFRKIVFRIALWFGVIAVVFGGALLFRGKHYAWISLCVSVLVLVPVFRSFEKRDTSSKELVILCVMIALSAAGRFIFAWLPGFKPVTAITVITAMWLGRDAGFAVGALSAAVSNFYFGQGPWTPFQMLAWGLIGFSAGVLAGPMRKAAAALCVFGAGGGGDVFAAYGHLDGAVGRRYVQPRALRRRGRIGAAGNCGICGVKRDLPFGFWQTPSAKSSRE